MAFARTKRFVQQPTPAIDPANLRTYITFNVGTIAAFFVHLGVLPIFWAFGAWELLLLNVWSELMYLGALLANRRGRHATTIALCSIELCVHQICAVCALGWEVGFQYYLLVLPAFVFSLPRARVRLQLLLVSAALATFVGLMTFAHHHAPLHPVPTRLAVIVGDVNVVAVFGLLAFFGYSYRTAAEEAELRLAAHERKQGEDRLGLLRAAVDAAQDAIIITDRAGRIEFVNDAFTAVTGYASAEVLGRTPRLLKSGEHGPEFYKELWGTITDGRSWSGKIVNLRKDGQRYTENATITPIREDGGKIRHFLAIKRDVTQAERAAELLARSEEQLRHAKKMEAIGTLAGGVAHDFNNLLTAILGNVDCLGDGLAPSDPRQEEVAEIRKAAQRAAQLTRQLLAYGRKQVLAPTVLDLRGVVLGIEKLLRRSASEHVEIRFELAESEVRIEADEAQLGQVLLNLVVNAKDAMPRGGAIVVATSDVTLLEPTRFGAYAVPAGSYSVVSVRDDGEGIPPDVLPLIFEPFFTTKPVGKGTGLGLSTVYGIVSQSGGFVTVQSEPGRGAEFRVFLPVVAGKSIAADEAPRARPVGDETVLLVEDEAAVRHVTARVLRQQGYVVLEASNGKQAIDLVAESRGRIDLLVTDVVMPGMDGPGLARVMHAKHPDVPVLFLSGYAGEQIEARGVFRPGDNFLGKPFAADALARLVRELIDRRRHADASAPRAAPASEP